MFNQHLRIVGAVALVGLAAGATGVATAARADDPNARRSRAEHVLLLSVDGCTSLTLGGMSPAIARQRSPSWSVQECRSPKRKHRCRRTRSPD